MSFHPAIPHPEIYPTDIPAHVSNDLWSKLSIEALLWLAKGRGKPKCPSTPDWLNKVWLTTYNGILCSRCNKRKLSTSKIKYYQVNIVKWKIQGKKCSELNYCICRKKIQKWYKMCLQRYVRNWLNSLPLERGPEWLENWGAEWGKRKMSYSTFFVPFKFWPMWLNDLS